MLGTYPDILQVHKVKNVSGLHVSSLTLMCCCPHVNYCVTTMLMIVERCNLNVCVRRFPVMFVMQAACSLFDLHKVKHY